MRIALAGNPNSGKITMYNALTGRSVGRGFVPGFLAVSAMVIIVIGMIFRANKRFAGKFELKKVG